MRKLLAFVFVFVGLFSEFQAQSICGGSSYTIVPTSTLTNPSYTLNPGNFSPNTNGNFVVSPSVTTTYTLLSSSGSATASSVIQVTVNAQPNSNVTYTRSTCTNSFNAVSLGLTFSPATPPPAYTLSWTPIPASVTSPQQFTATNLSPGPYSVVATAAGGCTAVINFTIDPQPAPAIYTVIPFGGIHSITCVQTTVDLSADNANNTYTWSGASFLPIQSQSISLNSTQLGTISVVGQNTVSGCTQTYTFLLAQNISNPTATLSTNLINITCAQAVAPTVSAIATPTVNVTHNIYSPLGGTFSATSYTTIYTPGGPGTYTHVIVDDANGCSTQRTFTVATSDNYPTFSVSSPNNFTLGCTTKSVGTINIIGAATTPTAGGPVSYTIIGPPTSTAIPTPPNLLSGLSSYTNITVPGTWTVIVRDNTNFCDTRTQVSVLQNTATPSIGANVPRQILDCNVSKVVLEGVSETEGVSYQWSFVATPGTVASNTITVNTNTASATSTVINIYTLTVTENNNTCKSTSVVPMYQNTFPPTTSISSGASSLTCVTPTIILTNQSKTGIPANTPFTTNSLVIGYLWEGPSPQMPLQVSSTYTAGVSGIYTLTAKDLNNGCLAKGNFTVIDNRNYPTLDAPPSVKKTYTIDCGSAFTTISPDIKPTSGLTYSWTGPGLINNNTGKTFDVGSPGNFSVVVTNTTNGCVTKGVYTAVAGSLTAVLVSDTDFGYAPLSVTFDNKSFSSKDSSNVVGLWSFGNGSMSGSVTTTGSFVPGVVSSTISQSTIYNQPGTYTVVMFAKKGGCVDTAYKVIRVDIPSSLGIPNVFTPNNDGINDLFFLKATNLTKVDITIYDRWGHVVYELVSETGNIAWDGKNLQGNDSAEGVYFYVIKTTGKDGVTNDKKGTINLYR